MSHSVVSLMFHDAIPCELNFTLSVYAACDVVVKATAQRFRNLLHVRTDQGFQQIKRETGAVYGCQYLLSSPFFFI